MRKKACGRAEKASAETMAEETDGKRCNGSNAKPFSTFSAPADFNAPKTSSEAKSLSSGEFSASNSLRREERR